MRNYNSKPFIDFDVNKIRDNFLTREYSMKSIDISILFTEWILYWDLLRKEELIEFIILNDNIISKKNQRISLEFSLKTLENQANFIYLNDGNLTCSVNHLKNITSDPINLISEEDKLRVYNLHYIKLRKLRKSDKIIANLYKSELFWRQYIIYNYNHRLPNGGLVNIKYLKKFSKNIGFINSIENKNLQAFRESNSHREFYYKYYTSLILRKKDKITDINILEDLRFLYLNNNNITDISNLRNLTTLRLGINENISYINMLVNLKILHLDKNNKISDISTLINLTILKLGNNNKISDISMLINLIELNLDKNNKISDISTLINLKKIYLGNNENIDTDNISDNVEIYG